MNLELHFLFPELLVIATALACVTVDILVIPAKRLTLVRDVAEAAIDDPRYYSRPVAADLVRRTADSAARALQAAADNPGIDVPDLFETARLVTASVRTAASGLPDRANDLTPARHLAAVRTEPTPSRAVALSAPVAR